MTVSHETLPVSSETPSVVQLTYSQRVCIVHFRPYSGSALTAREALAEGRKSEVEATSGLAIWPSVGRARARVG